MSYIERANHAMQQKHEALIRSHETRFGKLGELQTPEQKKALADEIARQKEGDSVDRELRKMMPAVNTKPTINKKGDKNG